MKQALRAHEVMPSRAAEDFLGIVRQGLQFGDVVAAGLGRIRRMRFGPSAQRPGRATLQPGLHSRVKCLKRLPLFKLLFASWVVFALREDKGVARKGLPPRGAWFQPVSAGRVLRSSSRAFIRRFILAVACVTR